MSFDSLKQYLDKPDFGLLFLRVAMGAMMIGHGIGKFMGGPNAFEAIGKNMAIFGIDFGYLYWGFFAALIQTVCGFFVMIGFLFRLSCFLIFGTMVVAVAYHLDAGDPILKGAGHALKTGTVFFALMFMGAGRYAVKS